MSLFHQYKRLRQGSRQLLLVLALPPQPSGKWSNVCKIFLSPPTFYHASFQIIKYLFKRVGGEEWTKSTHLWKTEQGLLLPVLLRIPVLAIVASLGTGRKDFPLRSVLQSAVQEKMSKSTFSICHCQDSSIYYSQHEKGLPIWVAVFSEPHQDQVSKDKWTFHQYVNSLSSLP